MTDNITKFKVLCKKQYASQDLHTMVALFYNGRWGKRGKLQSVYYCHLSRHAEIHQLLQQFLLSCFICVHIIMQECFDQFHNMVCFYTDVNCAKYIAVLLKL